MPCLLIFGWVMVLWGGFLFFFFFSSSSLLPFCFAVELMYWEVMRLRREMSLAKLGFYPSEM